VIVVMSILDGRPLSEAPPVVSIAMVKIIPFDRLAELVCCFSARFDGRRDFGIIHSSKRSRPPSPPLRNYFLGHGSARAEAVSSAPPSSSKSKEEANRPTFKIDNARRMKLCGTGQLQHSTMVTRSILTLKQGPENLAVALVSEGAFERSF
jgi:hypothetical protein